MAGVVIGDGRRRHRWTMGWQVAIVGGWVSSSDDGGWASLSSTVGVGYRVVVGRGGRRRGYWLWVVSGSGGEWNGNKNGIRLAD